MGRKNYPNHYSCKNFEKEVIKAKASNVSVHFKNTVEVANVIRGMSVVRANLYLKNVIAHKECVPFKNFKGGIGKTCQAKQFNCIIGRWPKKSAEAFLSLLKNVVANCELMGKDPEDFFILHVQVNPAAVRTRRTYRAHGRINPFERNLSHLQIILQEKEQ